MTTQVRNSELVNLLKADFINCWIPIAQYVAAGAVASITFANIPQIFRPLAVSINARTDRADTADAPVIRFNADAGNNYDDIYISGNNAAVVSGTHIADTFIRVGCCDAANSRANSFGGAWVWLPNYKNTNQEKKVWALSGNEGTPTAATLYLQTYNGQWRNINAITSLTFIPGTGPNFVADSTFILWGVL